MLNLVNENFEKKIFNLIYEKKNKNIYNYMLF